MSELRASKKAVWCYKTVSVASISSEPVLEASTALMVQRAKRIPLPLPCVSKRCRQKGVSGVQYDHEPSASLAISALPFHWERNISSTTTLTNSAPKIKYNWKVNHQQGGEYYNFCIISVEDLIQFGSCK